MNIENNIIAIRKRDINLAHEAFVKLMNDTENIFNKDACENPQMYKGLTSSLLEPCAVEKNKNGMCQFSFRCQ